MNISVIEDVNQNMASISTISFCRTTGPKLVFCPRNSRCVNRRCEFNSRFIANDKGDMCIEKPCECSEKYMHCVLRAYQCIYGINFRINHDKYFK